MKKIIIVNVILLSITLFTLVYIQESISTLTEIWVQSDQLTPQVHYHFFSLTLEAEGKNIHVTNYPIYVLLLGLAFNGYYWWRSKKK